MTSELGPFAKFAARVTDNPTTRTGRFFYKNSGLGGKFLNFVSYVASKDYSWSNYQAEREFVHAARRATATMNRIVADVPEANIPVRTRVSVYTEFKSNRELANRPL